MRRALKTRTILLVLFLGAIFLVAYLVALAFLSPNLVLEKKEGLGEQDFIAGRALPEGDAFHLGDAINYFVEIKYDPQKIEEIDKSSIDKSVILGPFEIKNQEEKESGIDSNTRVYLKEYKIQLLDGERDKLYEFPTITVRYKLRDSGWFDLKMTPQPIFIGSRVPLDITGLDLKPIEGKVVNTSRQGIPWLLAGLGVFCGVWGAMEIFRRIRKRKIEAKDYQKRIRGVEDIFKAYQDLVQKDDQPKTLLHQAHQIMRTLLSRREGIDWTSPDLGLIPQPIQYSTSLVLDVSQKAYNQESLGQKDLDEALRELGKIFEFYIGKGKVQ